MTYQQLAAALEAALSSADSKALFTLQQTLTDYATANPRAVEQVRKAPLVNALLNAIVDAEPRRAPLPDLMTVAELIAAFERAGYTYKREEVYGDAFSASGGCTLLRTVGNNTGVYAFRFVNQEGFLETGHAYVQRDVAGHLRAEH